MGLSFVWFQLPNMSIYFNQILGLAGVLYISYFLLERAFTTHFIKDEYEYKHYWIINRFLGVMRLLPIVFIIFAMYNIDNVSLINGLIHNECVSRGVGEISSNPVYHIK